MMKKLLDRFKADPEGGFDDGPELNDRNHRRNTLAVVAGVIVIIVVGLVGVIFLRGGLATQPEEEPDTFKPVDFGAVVDTEFTARDNQSALSAQQVTITSLERQIRDLTQIVTSQTQSNNELRKSMAKESAESKQTLRQYQLALEEALNESNRPEPPPAEADIPPATAGQNRYLGQTVATAQSATNYSAPGSGNYAVQGQPQQKLQSGIDTIHFNWDDDEETRKRTTDNYVPSGTIVTAVVTGGADANAGVNGQGDTTPVVLQTLDNGLLPNGESSQLKDCTFTAAAYGEVSTSRGIVRTNRMSCILDDEIIDIPVEATVFNFGRNGIRGNTVIRNGDIVQMAGVASLLKGTGEAASSLSQTTSTSALGTTSTVNAEDALLNILGEGGKGAGQTLADYYIKLAEQYHPFIELNPGNVVNIVILKGFPLDAVGIEEYEAELAMQQSAMPSPAAQIIETITNPLLKQLPTGAKPTAAQSATTPQASNQAASPFGLAQ